MDSANSFFSIHAEYSLILDYSTTLARGTSIQTNFLKAKLLLPTHHPIPSILLA